MRLTYRDSTVPHTNDKGELWEAYSDANYNEVINKLAAYEDAEEQGLLIRLPCKVGDTLFVPSQGTILDGTVDEIRVRGRDVYVFSNHDSANWVFTPANFGKTVFLTRAEAALKGR